jgi:hypothetical protein
MHPYGHEANCDSTVPCTLTIRAFARTGARARARVTSNPAGLRVRVVDLNLIEISFFRHYHGITATWPRNLARQIAIFCSL